MPQSAIEISHVAKKYKIEHGAKPKYRTMRDTITNALLSPFKKGNKINQNEIIQPRSYRFDSSGHLLWALQDVSFKVKPGEVVGLIGPNGAGKTTLLKILTRITYPTRGSIDLYGRVGSLLEVGTGFHKELTGRENVFLNGAILGMSKMEIQSKFDEIVAFAEMEKFIDTPVKFYSSGMGVRLAFAVAAHLEPEILLVDEVLAVGDATFQKKCLNKMESVGQEGRTIIFISHHMPNITRLCERAILLDQGNVVMDGPAFEVVGKYLSNALNTKSAIKWEDKKYAPGNHIVRLTSVRILDEGFNTRDHFDIRESIGIEMQYEILADGYVLYPGFSLHNEEGQWLFASIDTDSEWQGKIRKPGTYTSIGWIPGNLLSEGTFIIGPSLRSDTPNMVHVYEQEALAFQVSESPLDTISARMDFAGRFPGMMRPLLNWETLIFPEA
ncbi:MAG: ABC transporter [Anaerolineaceae bacterium]|nr:ABC transporter [Anaerolineaceae bacterium]